MTNPQMVRGYVFEDDRGDGFFRVGKKGVAGVAVTNQREVVRTDENGYYSLPIYEDCCISITKPAAYELTTDEYGQPQFFYRHFPKGTPSSEPLEYPGIAPTGNPPDLLNFPLRPSRKKDNFKAVMLGDIQPVCETEIGYFRDLMVDELACRDLDFIMPLGDLVWDKLDLLPQVRETLGATGHRWYPVCGNHDINLKATDPAHANHTFQRLFGPTYYSFDQGEVHFVVLDDIGYSGWDTDLHQKGETKGWMDDRQLDWLVNDLKHVPEDKLVFLASHIPIFTEIAADNDYRNVLNRYRLFDILQDRQYLFAVSAHTHFVERLDLRKGGWNGAASFPSLIAGAACGAWWKGPRDSDGLPVRMGMDGTPNGYFEFEFRGNEVGMHFCPAGKNEERHQMGIRFPKGEVAPHELPQQEVIVNIFRGHPEAEVSASIDGGPAFLLDRTLREDPHVREFLAAHRKHYPEWMRARTSAHIWTGRLLEPLGPGVHRLDVEAREPDGQVLRASRAFRVKPWPMPNAPVSERTYLSTDARRSGT